MSNYIYNYEEWLSGHANRKSMMEKLERSLIPKIGKSRELKRKQMK